MVTSSEPDCPTPDGLGLQGRPWRQRKGQGRDSPEQGVEGTCQKGTLLPCEVAQVGDGVGAGWTLLEENNKELIDCKA